MSLIELFMIFTKTGAILLGGGYVILPILANEFTDKRKIITSEELTNYFALSQSLPGIIAANMAMFIGYKLHGKLGAVVAIAGIIFVPFWCIVILSSVLEALVGNSIVEAALWGVGIAVIALITLTIKEIWQKTDKNAFFYFIFIMSLFTLLWLRLSPIQVILIFSIIGVLIKSFWRNK